MAKRGPKPIPGKILHIRGSRYAKDRLEHEPELGGRAPAIPDYLKSPEEKKCWHYLVKQIHTAGLLAYVDQFALGRYVRLYIQWRAMDAFVKEHGECYPIYDKERARPVGVAVFPQTFLARRYADQLLRLEQEFGMTPSARASLGIQLGKRRGGESRQENKARFFDDV
jgi:P27 family predicted phage terminase small subunit